MKISNLILTLIFLSLVSINNTKKSEISVPTTKYSSICVKCPFGPKLCAFYCNEEKGPQSTPQPTTTPTSLEERESVNLPIIIALSVTAAFFAIWCIAISFDWLRMNAELAEKSRKNIVDLDDLSSDFCA